MKILITGGFGFIGSALVRRCLRDGHQVVIIDAITYAANIDSVPSPKGGLEVRYFDVCDQAAVYSVMHQFEPDIVFHLAAESHVDNSIHGPKIFFDTNVMGTFSMAEAFRRYYVDLDEERRDKVLYVQVSTDEVFGETTELGPMFTEQSAYGPRSPYAASKAGADHVIESYRTTYDLPMVITHSCNNYGSWQNAEKFLPKAILCAMHKEEMPIYGDGLQMRQWIHVDDHVAALLFVAEKYQRGFDRFMIGGDHLDYNINVIKDLAVAMGSPILVKHVSDRPGHDKCYKVGSARLRELGWEPKVNWYDGLRATADWYRAERK